MSNLRSLKPGGASRGSVPSAATHASEWVVPGLSQKHQVLVIDCATKLRVAVPLMEPYGINQMRTESFSQVIEAVSKSWLAHYPKPDVIIPVNAWALSQRSSPTSAATRTLSCPCLLKSISSLGLTVCLKMPCGSSNIPQLRFRCTTLHKIHL